MIYIFISSHDLYLLQHTRPINPVVASGSLPQKLDVQFSLSALTQKELDPFIEKSCRIQTQVQTPAATTAAYLAPFKNFFVQQDEEDFIRNLDSNLALASRVVPFDQRVSASTKDLELINMFITITKR